MGSFKTGFTSVTFRKHKATEDVVAIASRAQVDCIEWGSDVHVKSLDDALRAKELCGAAGIEICSYGSYHVAGSCDEAAWRQTCLIADALGAKSVRVWLGKSDSEKTDDAQYARLLADTRAMCDEAARYGLLVCAECHPGTYNNDTDAFLRFKRDVERDNFKTYFQSKYRRLEYDLDRIDRTFTFTENVHVSYSEFAEVQLLTNGNSKYIDILLKKLRDKGFGGAVIIEFTDLSGKDSIINDIKKLKSY